jgi:putative peptidoglycan lipid II flippase
MHTLNRGLELSMLLTLPATVALMVIPWPIVVVLFERSAFDRTASEATALALAAFAAGLPAYVLVKVLQPAFFAREDTVTPFKTALASVAANIALGLLLFWPLGHVGIALATALAAWLNTALLAVMLHRRGFLILDAPLKARLPRISLASLVMGLALWAAARWLGPWFDAGIWLRLAGLASLVGGGLALYGGLAYGLHALDHAALRALFKRRGGGASGDDITGPPA